VTIPDGVAEIGVGAFVGCGSLTNVSLPNTLITIEGLTFHSCSNLSNIRIPESVTRIAEEAFIYSGITSIRIPGSVTRIENGAFRDCYNLTNVIVAAGATATDTFWNCPDLKAIHFCGNRPQVEPTEIGRMSPELAIYYLPGTSGWSTSFGGKPTTPWLPAIRNQALRSSATEFAFDIFWAEGKAVAVEVQEELGIIPREVLETITLPENGVTEFVDSQIGNKPSKFYRVKSAN
jgi:hypothetical protein